MSDLVRLRVVTAFSTYREGDIIERTPSVAREMLGKRWYGRKLVEPVPEPQSPPHPEKTDDSPTEHQVRQPAQPRQRRDLRNRERDG